MTSSPTRIVRGVGMVAGAILALAVLPAEAQGNNFEFWMVRPCRAGTASARHGEAHPFDYLRLDGRRVWRHASREAFFDAADLALPTVLFAHGGFTDEAHATRLVLGLSRALSRFHAGRRVRLVLWRWPSERSLCRIRPALQMTVARADFQGILLARWLRQFDGLPPPTLVGYSAGCRVIAEGLGHYASSAAAEKPPSRFHAVLVAAACDADILLRRRTALEAAESLLVTLHRGDRVLRLYPHLYRGPSPQALGYAGVARPQLLGPRRHRLEMLDLTRSITGRHDLLHYLSASPLTARLARLVMDAAD